MNKLDEINAKGRRTNLIGATFLALMLLSGSAGAAPINDVASPDQGTRDAAARILRATWQPSPRAKWEPLLGSLKLRMTRSAFGQVIAPYRVSAVPGFRRGGISCENCRLDDTWVLFLNFHIKDYQKPTPDDPDDTLISWNLVQQVRGINVEIPRDYTGTWTLYYANGQKEDESSFRDGVLFGTFICYDENGARHAVAHYGATGLTDETNYFPSGQIRSQNLVSNGFDHSTQYREDGTVEYTHTDSIRSESE